MTTVVIHGTPTSTYARTCLLALEEKGVGDYQVIPNGTHTPDQDRVHPWGKVPAMTHGEVHLFETLAITQYLDGAFDGPALQPSSHVARAVMTQWISTYNDNFIKPTFPLIIQRLVRLSRAEAPDEKLIAEVVPGVRQVLGVFERTLGQSQYLAGSTLSLADLFLLPNMHFLSMTGEAQVILKDMPALRNWMARLLDRSSSRVALQLGN